MDHDGDASAELCFIPNTTREGLFTIRHTYSFLANAMTGPNLHLDSTFGCFFIGTLFSSILYGCTCAQGGFYCWNYRDDKTYTKCIVAIVWLLDTAENMINVQLLWYYFVQNHANVLEIVHLVSTFAAFQVIASLTAFLVQCFFISNIWRFLINRWYRLPLAIVASCFSLASFVSGMVMVHELSTIQFITDLGPTIKVIAFVDLPCALATDIFIAVSLVWILHNSRTGFNRTESMITKLIIYSAHRGIIVLVAQLLVLGTFFEAVKINHFIVLVFYSSTTTLYVNTFLAVLNARRHIAASGSVFSGIDCSTEVQMDGWQAKSFSHRSEPLVAQDGNQESTVASHLSAKRQTSAHIDEQERSRESTTELDNFIINESQLPAPPEGIV